MNGFVLRTIEKTYYCEKCRQFAAHHRHRCKVSDHFEKLGAGTPDYKYWVDRIADWDTGLWNTIMITQVAFLLEYDAAYILMRDFYDHYHASFVSENTYARLKPGGLIDLQCNKGHHLYVNPDLSAGLLSPDTVGRIMAYMK